MDKRIEMVRISGNHQNEPAPAACRFGVRNAGIAFEFHRSFPEYEETPLVSLDSLAGKTGVRGIYVKDESRRFGLNAFKGLGGSFCIAKIIAEKLGISEEEMRYECIADDAAKEKTGELTFVTATDGNHGRGIAWTASRLHQKSVVFMPEGSSAERLSNICALGAAAEITDMNYDDTVRFAKKYAEEHHAVLVQDTSWDGYEKIPADIMQGYTTMGIEIRNQLGDTVPTHIFLQAGVGAMSGAMSCFFTDLYRNQKKPVIVIAEPENADCIFRTAEADDGRLHKVTGSLHTIMAGLACGEPCGIGWAEIRRCADFSVSMKDEIAAYGMRILGNPLGNDRKVISGESGAAGFGLAAAILTRDEYKDIKEEIGLDRNSVVLCISTEGDTDREHYRNIVWDGRYPLC